MSSTSDSGSWPRQRGLRRNRPSSATWLAPIRPSSTASPSTGNSRHRRIAVSNCWASARDELSTACNQLRVHVWPSSRYDIDRSTVSMSASRPALARHTDRAAARTSSSRAWPGNSPNGRGRGISSRITMRTTLEKGCDRVAGPARPAARTSLDERSTCGRSRTGSGRPCASGSPRRPR